MPKNGDSRALVNTSPATSFDTPSAEAIANALGGKRSGRGWMCHCPAHKDDTPSLSISDGEDGKVLVHCHAGCCQDAVIDALRARELWKDNCSPFRPRQRANGQHKPKIAVITPEEFRSPPSLPAPSPEVQTLYVFDELPGKSVSRVHVYGQSGVRVKVKLKNELTGQFLQYFAVSVDGKTQWQPLKPKGFRPLPYVYENCDPFRPDAEGPLFWPEGEKDVDTLAAYELDAFTFGGANEIPLGAELYVKGRNVVILADNDDVGRKCAEQKTRQCRGRAASIKVVHFPDLPEGGDVTNYMVGITDKGDKLVSPPHTVDELLALVKQTPEWTPPRNTTPAKTSWRDRTLTAAALQYMRFPPVSFVVPDLVPEGLSILAGKPKIGKSWGALDICIAVAAGRYCLGDRKPVPGDVLYCALEDNPRRMQRRMDKLLPALSGTWPEQLILAHEWRRLDQGGVDDLGDWIDSVANPRLVVLDTLAGVRPIRTTNGYMEDYESLAALHRLANERGIAVLVLHHTRKMEADDPIDTVSGTLGLAGCADTVLVLNRTSQGTTLYVRGRDIEEAEHAVTFDRHSCRWTILGSAAEVHRSNERGRVLAALQKATELMKPQDIADATEMPCGNVRVLLGKMVEDGEVIKVDRGRYCHPDRADLVPPVTPVTR